MSFNRDDHERIVAVAMLVGDLPPVKCSGCKGSGWSHGVAFFGPKRCYQCVGSGYDVMGTKTKEAWDAIQKETASGVDGTSGVDVA